MEKWKAAVTKIHVKRLRQINKLSRLRYSNRVVTTTLIKHSQF